MLDLFQTESDRVSAENVRHILDPSAKGGVVRVFRPDLKIRLYALLLKNPAQDVPDGLTRDLEPHFARGTPRGFGGLLARAGNQGR